MEDTKSLLQEMKEGVDRIKSIVQGLKEFSHVDSSGFNANDLNAVIENSIKLVFNQVMYHCVVDKKLCEILSIRV